MQTFLLIVVIVLATFHISSSLARLAIRGIRGFEMAGTGERQPARK
jgi:hypothetical protein